MIIPGWREFSKSAEKKRTFYGEGMFEIFFYGTLLLSMRVLNSFEFLKKNGGKLSEFEIENQIFDDF